MPKVILKQDNLNELNANYVQHALLRPVLLNSVPKCGTHLIKNIFRMFVPVSQQYHKAFIQLPILKNNLSAFNQQIPHLSWGHLLFSDESAIALQDVKHIIVVRDPYDWVLARARFFLSDSFQGSMEHLKNGRVSITEILNMMIFGVYQKAPTLQEIYTHNAIAWLGTGIKLVRYEDIVKNLKNIDKNEAEIFFTDLLSVLGFDELPADWRARVLTGADRKQSGTFRENLSGSVIDLPETLPDMQKQLVEYAAPGLRSLLGYY
ncbi:MAG: hypothetical protein CVV11_12750 [Gammaproteobacteria bacterium HGW-Gammaproteobacteria-15]|nr:MAG: hypothetical protein CVV11_12750 [Gammaproteobacteria bacterium HGW-Gammaproteobacteria-15]